MKSEPVRPAGLIQYNSVYMLTDLMPTCAAIILSCFHVKPSSMMPVSKHDVCKSTHHHHLPGRHASCTPSALSHVP